MGILARVKAKLNHIKYCRAISQATLNVVHSGPFKGMKYKPSRRVSYSAKLLGTYELELSEIVEKLCRGHYDLIVNVGAADGYYSVGFAFRNPKARVVAFEANPQIHPILKEVAQLNGVSDRISVLGFCNPEGLANSLREAKRPLVVMDVEGGEAELLAPGVIPQLQACAILVEIHDFVSPKIGPELMDRFSKSHSLVEIWAKDRQLSDFPSLLAPASQLDDALKLSSMNEGRPERMRWFFMDPLTRPDR